MKVAVCQPMYLPWIGYFALMDKVDVYVFYDDVQFSPQSWQQRNRIKTGNGIQWLTIPIKRNFGQKICDVEINTDVIWRVNHAKAIEQAYSKAPNFEPYSWYIDDFYQMYWYYLSDLTIYESTFIAEMLDVELPEFLKSSEMNLTGSKDDRLLELLEKVGATEYISGVKAKDYIDEDKFKKAGIKLTWFEYEHPVYPQIRGEFVPYMSAIDLMFNVGKESVKYVHQG